MANISLSQTIKSEKIQQIQNRVDSNSKTITDIVNDIIAPYCRELDEFLAKVKTLTKSKNLSNSELENIMLNLPLLLYFTGNATENIGVKEDIAKAIKQELYNDIFQNSEGTIADKTSKAELSTQSEYITHIAYQRAYKKLKNKIEMGNEVLSSVKKVLTHRIAETELSRRT